MKTNEISAMNEIHNILEKQIREDYYTANIKAEVLFDMLLTPVISEILTVIGQENKKLGINGEMRLLAKEFPMFMPDKEKSDYRNCNADYLMCDNDAVYFVELKTTQESFKDNQMQNYLNYLTDCKNKRFADVSGEAFIDLLNHVSKTGYSRNSKNKPWGKNDKDDLKQLFEAIIHYPEHGKDTRKISFEKEWEKEDCDHIGRAITYLRNEKAVSSKKYLLTAGQMLDHMKDGNWWYYDKIKLLYLLPEASEKQKHEDQESKYYKLIEEYHNRNQIDKEDIITITFKDIIKRANKIEEKLGESKKSDLKDYWKWVVKLLEECGLNDSEQQ